MTNITTLQTLVTHSLVVFFFIAKTQASNLGESNQRTSLFGLFRTTWRLILVIRPMTDSEMAPLG